jgi:ABC-2 type transport system ATP-binding protein
MIETVGLTKRFGELVAVDRLDLAVGPGEILALLGPNGAGKTTTVRMLASILQPTAGRATVAGYDVVKSAASVRRRVGVLTEAPGLYGRMTGLEYLDFFGELWGMPGSSRRARIAQLAEQFQLRDALPRRLSTYSKGMRQKVALVRTLLHDPPVLLFDEPTSAMDPGSARLVRDAILQIRADGQRCAIVCTHNLPEAEELSDRIAIIREGRIVAKGTLAELRLQLLGAPLMELRLHRDGMNGEGTNRDGVRQIVERFAELNAVGDSRIRYSTPDPDGTNPRIVAALAAEGHGIVTLSEVPRSLEKVYLQVVGERSSRGG